MKFNYRLSIFLLASSFVFIPNTYLKAAQVSTFKEMNITDLFQAGGWAMYVLLVLSVILLGLIFYNALVIRLGRFVEKNTLESLDVLLEKGDFEQAGVFCREHPSVITNVVKNALDRVGQGSADYASIKEAGEEASLQEFAGPTVMINLLSLIASLAPMLGLLGTVSGMIKAFRTISDQGIGQPQLLAGNISEALITTATGLFIAVPAIFFYFFFKNRYANISSQIVKILGNLFFKIQKALEK